MLSTWRLQWRRIVYFGVCIGWLACAPFGCQSYTPAPLDIATYRDELEARFFDSEPVSAFAERLRSAGADAPDRFDPSDGLTLAEGEALALFYNADLRLARLRAGVALATFENAGLWQDPVFGFDGAEILSPTSPFEFGLTLSLTIPVSGRLSVATDRAGALYEAELRRIVDAEWSMRAHVRRGWAKWTIAEERARLLDDIVAQVERISSITNRLETAGELNRVEGRLFRVELASRRAALNEAILQAQQARFELLRLMGLPPDALAELVSAIPTTEAPTADDDVRRLIESNTEIAIKRAQYHAAEESLRLEIRKQYPDITIGSGYGSENNDDRLLLGVSVPIPVLNANRANIMEARAEREVVRAAAETTFERLIWELATANATLEATRTQRSAVESQIIPMLTEQAEEVEQIAELGEVNALLLLETVTRQFGAKAQLLDLRLAELGAAISIAQLLGPDAALAPAPIADGATANETQQHDSAGDAAGGDQ